MADAVLGVVVENLSSLIQKEFGLIWGVDEELKNLSSTLSTVRNVLEDTEMMQLKDKAIGDSLKKLKDAAYDADDIVDELQLEADSTDLVCSSFLYCLCFEQIIFRHKMGRRISEISARLDKIADERLKFHLREGVVDRETEIGERETGSIPPPEAEVYGRDKDKKNIVKQLLNNVSNPQVLSIYPIIGMGGLGKTTLAQLVYNDDRVLKHFDLRAWVCVSEPFDIKKLLKETIKSARGNTSDLTDSALDPIQHRLREILSGKRFLLVLDDVWNENEEQWDNMKRCLTCGAQGSSIVVTTRMVGVATIMSTLPAHHLKQLSEDDCWSLFKHRAFGIWREENPDLIEIGREIVKKCRGVPLAAKALGGMMCRKSNKSDWLKVRDSELWEIDDEEKKILPALRLSYNHLPSRLRQCFAYCCVFPKDSIMEKEDLIQLWMANGFIQSKERMELEDIGNEIFNDLLWRSFFQNIKKDEYGNIITCKMHDLVHDLACSVMVDECSIMEVRKAKDISKRIRHLFLIFDLESLSNPRQSLLKSQPIHTLILQNNSGKIISHFHFIFSNLRCLRALELSYVNFTNLPGSIGKLKYLRYLNISHTSITALPESVSSLRNLQTLKLRGCHKLQKLPRDMRKMSSLRHLDISGCKKLTEMPIGMGQLIYLQTLSKFIVGQKSGCHVKELQELNHLKGELSIERLENVRNLMEAKEAELIRKQNLFSLELRWMSASDDGEACFQENYEEVLESLQPPPNIRYFRIQGYGGVKFLSWMRDLSLPNLVRVSLVNCRRCEHLPPLGQLRHLKYLLIKDLNCVKYIGKEFYGGEGTGKGFPSLVNLSISAMNSLEEWSKEEAGAVLPCLSTLVIQLCPKLKSLPLIPSLKHLEVGRSNEVILRSLGNLTTLEELKIDYGAMDSSEDLPGKTIGYQFDNTADESSPELTNFPKGIRHLTSLRTLKIWRCPNLTSLPEGLQHLTSLQTLEIVGWPNLKSLEELQHLTSLQTLEIWDCKKLTSLPEGLQHLTALQDLKIYDWPHLEIRCQRDKGEDWPKISHIPRVTINYNLQ